MSATLFYVADPMCSWCWGFAPVLEAVRAELGPRVPVRYVMGGLAPDSDEPMPEATRRYVRAAWDAVERASGARFNRAFWERQEPRRSTWPACRAVIAAEWLAPGAGAEMFAAIQRAYYVEARNPSLRETLCELAGELGRPLDADRFARALDAPETNAALHEDFALRDRLGVTGFPSLALKRDGVASLVVRGYVGAREALAAVSAALA